MCIAIYLWQYVEQGDKCRLLIPRDDVAVPMLAAPVPAVSVPTQIESGSHSDPLLPFPFA